MGFLKYFGRKVKHPDSEVNFHYTQGRQFGPGAENFSPIKNQQDPLYRLRGAGTPVLMQFNALQPPQAFIPLMVPTNGLGGVIPGGIVFQQSIDAENGGS